MANCTILLLIIYGIIGAILYRHIPMKYRQLFLLLYSCVLYFIWTSISVVIIVLVESVLIWYLSALARKGSHTKAYMWTGIAVVVVLLGYYKYLIIA